MFSGEPARSSTDSVEMEEDIPFGTQYPKKKKKNLNNEYIDLKSLLDSKEEPLSVTISTGVTNLHQSQKSKVPISIGSRLMLSSLFRQFIWKKISTDATNVREMQRCMMIRHLECTMKILRNLGKQLMSRGKTPFKKYASKLHLLNINFKIHNKISPALRTIICFQFKIGER